MKIFISQKEHNKNNLKPYDWIVVFKQLTLNASHNQIILFPANPQSSTLIFT